MSDPELGKLFAAERQTIYSGFDPTSTSLQLGNLVPVMAMSHLQRAGHRVLLLVGGATGMIGDPSGKSEERKLLGPEDVQRNVDCIRAQLSTLLDFEGANPATIVNNLDWIGPMTFIEWLRDVGKHLTINYMIAKDSVKNRLASEQGISFTEFSYMTMQAYDFLHLFEREGCKVQLGGNDQWGNITAGIELVRKKRGEQAYGITLPLLTSSTGEKLGKSAGNSIWVDPERTSPYQFYQYWMQTEDADVARFLKIISFIEVEAIDALAAEHMQAPERRAGQRRLAEEATRMIHGEAGLARAQRASAALFGGELGDLDARDLSDIFADVPASEVGREKLEAGVGIVALLVETGLCKSNGDARRQIEGGAVYVNNVRVESSEASVGLGDLLAGSAVVLRMGKKRYQLVRAGG